MKKATLALIVDTGAGRVTVPISGRAGTAVVEGGVDAVTVRAATVLAIDVLSNLLPPRFAGVQSRFDQRLADALDAERRSSGGVRWGR